MKKEKEYHFNIISKEGPMISRVNFKDNLYIYFLINQDKNCEVLRLTTDFQPRGRYIIRRGQGPGEALNPRIYGGNEQSIIVYDAPGFKYIRFDPEFALLDEYRLKKDMGVFLYSGARYVPEHNCVVDGFCQFLSYYDSLIRIYVMQFTDSKKIEDQKLFETKNVEQRKNTDIALIGDPVHFGWFFDHIYILDKRDYRIIKMDIRGKIVKDIKIHFKSRTFSKEIRKKWINQFYINDKFARENFDFIEKLWSACWILQIGSGIAVGRCENYDPDEKGPVPADYFDSDLNYLGRITIPYFYYWNNPGLGQSILDITFYSKDGKLYFITNREEEECSIVRYAIIHEKN